MTDPAADRQCVIHGSAFEAGCEDCKIAQMNLPPDLTFQDIDRLMGVSAINAQTAPAADRPPQSEWIEFNGRSLRVLSTRVGADGTHYFECEDDRPDGERVITVALPYNMVPPAAAICVFERYGEFCGQPEDAPCGHDHLIAARLHGDATDLKRCSHGHPFMPAADRAADPPAPSCWCGQPEAADAHDMSKSALSDRPRHRYGSPAPAADHAAAPPLSSTEDEETA